MYTDQSNRYENVERAPFAFNAGGVARVRDRAKANTNSATLDAVGGGGHFPLYYLDLAENGNYLETNEVAKRTTPCGDPRLVRVCDAAFWLIGIVLYIFVSKQRSIVLCFHAACMPCHCLSSICSWYVWCEEGEVRWWCISTSVSFAYSHSVDPPAVFQNVPRMFQSFGDEQIIYSTPNRQWEVLHTFEAGQEIEIDVVIVYYHWVSVLKNERRLVVSASSKVFRRIGEKDWGTINQLRWGDRSDVHEISSQRAVQGIYIYAFVPRPWFAAR